MRVEEKRELSLRVLKEKTRNITIPDKSSVKDMLNKVTANPFYAEEKTYSFNIVDGRIEVAVSDFKEGDLIGPNQYHLVPNKQAGWITGGAKATNCFRYISYDGIRAIDEKVSDPSNMLDAHIERQRIANTIYINAEEYKHKRPANALEDLINNIAEGKGFQAKNFPIQGEGVRELVHFIEFFPADGNLPARLEIVRTQPSTLSGSDSDNEKSRGYLMGLKMVEEQLTKVFEQVPSMIKPKIEKVSISGNLRKMYYSDSADHSEKILEYPDIIYSPKQLEVFRNAVPFESIKAKSLVDLLTNDLDSVILRDVPVVGANREIQFLRVAKDFSGSVVVSAYHFDVASEPDNAQLLDIANELNIDATKKYYLAVEAKGIVADIIEENNIEGMSAEVSGMYLKKGIVGGSVNNGSTTSILSAARKNLDVLASCLDTLPSGYDVSRGSKDENNLDIVKIKDLSKESIDKIVISAADVFDRLKNHPEHGDLVPWAKRIGDLIEAADESFISINDLLEYVGLDLEMSKSLSLTIDKMVGLGSAEKIIDEAVKNIKLLPNHTRMSESRIRSEFVSHMLDNAVSRGSILMKWLNKSTDIIGDAEEITIFDKIPAIIGSKCRSCPYVRACTHEVMQKDSIAKFSGIRVEAVIEMMHNGIKTISDFQKVVEAGFADDSPEAKKAMAKVRVAGVGDAKIMEFYFASFTLSGEYDLAINLNVAEEQSNIVRGLGAGVAAPYDYEGKVVSVDTPTGPRNLTIKYMNDESVYVAGERIWGGGYFKTSLTRETSIDCGRDMYSFIRRANEIASNYDVGGIIPVAYATYDKSCNKNDISVIFRDNYEKLFDILAPKTITEKVEKYNYDNKYLRQWFAKYAPVLNVLRTGNITVIGIESMIENGLVSRFKYLGGKDDEACDVPVGDIGKDIASRRKFVNRLNLFHTSKKKSLVVIGGVEMPLSGSNYLKVIGSQMMEELIDNVRLPSDGSTESDVSDTKVKGLFNAFIAPTNSSLRLMYSNDEELSLSSKEKEIADSVFDGIDDTERDALISQVMGTVDLNAALRKWVGIPSASMSIKYLAKTMGSVREESDGITGGDSIAMINLISERDELVRVADEFYSMVKADVSCHQLLELIDDKMYKIVHHIEGLYELSILLASNNGRLSDLEVSKVMSIKESLSSFVNAKSVIADKVSHQLAEYSKDDGKELMYVVNGANIMLDMVELVDDPRFDLKRLPNGNQGLFLKAGFGGDFFEGYVNVVRDNTSASDEIIDMLVSEETEYDKED